MRINLNLVCYIHKTYSDGTHPIMLQYTIDRKARRRVLARCQKRDWDDRSKRLRSNAPNAEAINHYLTVEYLKAEKELYEIKLGTRSRSEIFRPQVVMTIGNSSGWRPHKSGQYDKV